MKSITLKKTAVKEVKSLKSFEISNIELQKISGGLRIDIRRDENGNVIISPVQE